MAISVTMPALSPTMTEGKVAAWHKAVGDAVAPGDVLAEIETDKAIMEIEAVDEGTLGKILVAEGTEEVPVNSVIAMILEEGEGQDALDAAVEQAPQIPTPAPTAEPAATPTPTPAPPPVTVAAPSVSPSMGRIVASPLARRMARDAGIDLSTLQGSGPGGRIIKRDVEGRPA
ncbi:MAG: pyruvate dehydrogenase complex dihydrolipoamide acetyltransferase, partial [Alphaproteobacteria bacterium]|nr:pyruvate dehydrogenase complex dihydrolipoamide acetyltransferase [Alphaproteobacteria bacterium]